MAHFDDPLQKLPLSAVLISFNEERNIARCIKSLDFVQEVLVVDSQSQDRTAQIAKDLGARVIDQPWLGYGRQKQFAVDQAKFDWVLSIDCDEEVSPELKNEIIDQWKELRPEVAVAIPRISQFLGLWIRHGGWYPDLQTRLFHRGNCRWTPVEIHETVEAKSKVSFQAPLRHYVFRDIEHQVATNNRYSTLQARELFRQGKRSSLFRILLKPLGKFFECYFFKLGCLDGWPGFVIAYNAAYSMYLKWVKLHEMWRTSQ